MPSHRVLSHTSYMQCSCRQHGAGLVIRCCKPPDTARAVTATECCPIQLSALGASPSITSTSSDVNHNYGTVKNTSWTYYWFLNRHVAGHVPAAVMCQAYSPTGIPRLKTPLGDIRLCVRAKLRFYKLDLPVGDRLRYNVALLSLVGKPIKALALTSPVMMLAGAGCKNISHRSCTRRHEQPVRG